MQRIWKHVRGWRVGVVVAVVWMAVAHGFLAWFAASCDASLSGLGDDREEYIELAEKEL